MAELGHYTLCIAWILSVYGILAGIYSGVKNQPRLFLSVRNSTILVAVCSVAAISSLGYSFYVNDYSLQYVWQYSNKDMEPYYRISAIWGGMDGSMLLWCTMLTLGGAIVAWKSTSMPRLLMPWVLSVINSSSFFFLTVVVFLTNPFRYLRSDFIPPDGNGLNPLLQNPLMVIHPPMLYLGFTGFAIPFAFCVGALLSGYLTNDWIRLTRRWTLLSWMFLTIGIILGGHWAYVELGWGGFWAWDPVENASFLPWLTGTAFLHSVMVQERKNMLKLWNVWLIVLTYGLTVFGTFLTRSGVVQSVHAFAETDVGWVFLVYLGVIVAVSAVLSVYRRTELRSEREIESFLCRESIFLLNNLVLLSICFATTWGVLFPILSEAVTGVKQTVGPPFFNKVNIPLFLFLIFLMGVGPLIAWRKASLKNLLKIFTGPFLFGSGLMVILVWAGVTEIYPAVSYGLCGFVLMTIMGELHRGVTTLKASPGGSKSYLSGFTTLIGRHRSRYAGYLVHFGVLVATVGITASMAHKVEKEFSLGVGEETRIGRFILRLEDFESGNNGNYEYLTAIVPVFSGASGELITILRPEKRGYLRTKEPTTEVALRMGLREDIYLVIAGMDEKGEKGIFKIFINPLQIWLWFGGIIMALGSLVLLMPTGSRIPATEKADTRRKVIA